jgi:hypothetical protein
VNINPATIKRDKRLRRRLLDALYTQRGNGHCTGRFLLDALQMYLPPGDRFQSDAHILALLVDLVSKGYVAERDDRERHTDPNTIDYRSYVITGHGVSLIEQSIAADPDIEDDRIIK